jgi:fatty acid synthase subunit alpha
MAADGFGRSVPAPGQGALTFARETRDAINSPLLNIEYRREQMEHAMLNMLRGRNNSSLNKCPRSPCKPASEVSDQESLFDMLGDKVLSTSMRSIKRRWGNDIRQLDPSISPLRAGLAIWNLSVDDISVVSMHGTSTKANDLNEGKVITQQMNHLQRQAPPLLAICQKSLTGHPKAPAASWMLNGCLQVLGSGFVPGNAKADNVDPALRAYHHLVYPTEPIQTDGVTAFLLNSFGFGQKGGQMVGVAPRYLFATLPKDLYTQYSTRCLARQKVAQQAFAKAILDKTMCKIKEPQLTPSDVLLRPAECDTSDGPDARSCDNSINAQLLRADLTRLLDTSSPWPSADNSDSESSDCPQDAPPTEAWIHCAMQERPSSNVFRVGIDNEDVKTFTSDQSPTFVQRNFTAHEREHFTAAVDPHAALVGRWCAKEAVFKSLNTRSKGAGAAMHEIEIVSVEGVPRVNVSIIIPFPVSVVSC